MQLKVISTLVFASLAAALALPPLPEKGGLAPPPPKGFPPPPTNTTLPPPKTGLPPTYTPIPHPANTDPGKGKANDKTPVPRGDTDQIGRAHV